VGCTLKKEKMEVWVNKLSVKGMPFYAGGRGWMYG
jgi:hypothetical protein